MWDPIGDQLGERHVEARRLVKRFGDFTAVAGIDFHVDAEETFGFLGPNGAGKTSAMRMVVCTSQATEGSLRVFGLDPDASGPEIRSRLGVVSQDDNLDTDLTVWDNLVIYGRYFGIGRSEVRERAEELLEFAWLVDRRDERVDPLSGGMKRRLAIARALINRPEMLLLDEPTTGLDPQARHLLWERLWTLKQQGVTLLLTTHYMDEAEQLCDRLVVMDGGRIVEEGSPRQLIDHHCPGEAVEVRYRTRAIQDEVIAGLGVHELRIDSLVDRVVVYAADGEAAASWLHEASGVEPASVIVRRTTLEDVFLTLTGRTLEEV